MPAPRSITIVGASLAGLNAAEALRSAGYDGAITMIGAEPDLPYDRPPLSKHYLSGQWDRDRLDLLKPDRKDELNIEWRLGVRATALDLATRSVTLDDGSSVPGDGVVIATGGSARSLAGTASLGGLHTLRTIADARDLRKDLDAVPSRVVVVGAGFIGAEVAATARERGLEVTMVEMAAVPLGHAIGDRFGQVCADMHRDHGVDLRTGVGVEKIEGEERVTSVRLTDGSTVEADVVVVGIGCAPATDWLVDSGLTIDNGVVCDETCLAAPGVVAAGDVARWPNGLFGEMMRVEHWDNAIEQGGVAARRLLAADGEAPAYQPVPWFWSDQYDRKIQMAGRIGPDDEMVVVDGSTEDRRFTAIARRDDQVVGVLAFNRPRLVMKYKQLIAQHTSWADALAAADS